MRYYYRERVRCSICGNVDEGYMLEIDLWFLTLERGICEKCLSRMFRGLHKERSLSRVKKDLGKETIY